MDKLCSGFELPATTAFMSGTTWRVPRNLKPGAYVLAVSLSVSRGSGAAANENGLVGILVSRTQTLRVLPRPHCQ